MTDTPLPEFVPPAQPPEDAVEVQAGIPRMSRKGQKGFSSGQSCIRIHGTLAWVSLTKDQWAIIDSADIELVARLRWYAFKPRYTFYAARSEVRGTKRVAVSMHGAISGAPLTDHKNSTGLDNRKTNLRACTGAQNAANRAVQSNSKSGIKGVWFDKSRDKWVAAIGFEGKTLPLGRFRTADEAQRAYCDKAVQLYGEFARAD